MSTELEAPGTRLAGPVPRSARRLLPSAVVGVVLAAVAASWSFTMGQASVPTPGLSEGLTRLGAFFERISASGQGASAWTDAAAWRGTVGAAADTLAMSVVAMAIAAAGVLGTLPGATHLLMSSHPHLPRRTLRRLAFGVIRSVHMFARAVPEVVWALLIVFILQPGVLTGAIALAVHEFGVLGRLASDVADDSERGPLHALRSSGAGSQQLLWYGVLPQALPHLVGFLLYRWEVAIRATVVVGFITGGGLGYDLRLALSFRDWTRVGLILVAYALLVWAVEAAAVFLRRLAR